MIRGLCSVLVCLVFLVATAAAQSSGADPTELARGHFERATAAFDAGDYERAVQEFRAAHELTPHPDLLFNVYSAAERAGMLSDAADALRSYLDQAPTDPRRATLEERLARLEDRIEAQRSARSNDVPVAPTEPPAVAAPIEPITPAREAPPADPHWGAIGAWIAAGVLAINAAVFIGLSEVEDQRVATDCGRDAGRTCSDRQLETLLAFNVVADASWIAAAVAAAIGVTLFVLGPRDRSARAQFAPWALPEGAGLVVRGRL